MYFTKRSVASELLRLTYSDCSLSSPQNSRQRIRRHHRRTVRPRLRTARPRQLTVQHHRRTALRLRLTRRPRRHTAQHHRRTVRPRRLTAQPRQLTVQHHRRTARRRRLTRRHRQRTAQHHRRTRRHHQVWCSHIASTCFSFVTLFLLFSTRRFLTRQRTRRPRRLTAQHHRHTVRLRQSTPPRPHRIRQQAPRARNTRRVVTRAPRHLRPWQAPAGQPAIPLRRSSRRSNSHEHHQLPC